MSPEEFATFLAERDPDGPTAETLLKQMDIPAPEGRITLQANSDEKDLVDKFIADSKWRMNGT